MQKHGSLLTIPRALLDNNAFLGKLEPGMAASARYVIEADAAAEPKTYTFDSSIRFRDVRGNSLESDTTPVQITVVPTASGTSGIPGGYLTLASGLIAVIVICIAFLVYSRKMEDQ